MVPSKEELSALIMSAIEELNQQLSEDKQLQTSSEMRLFGQGSPLDSLGLVTLALIIEERVEEDFGINISLADDRAVSQRNSPFRNIEALTEYLLLLLNEGAK